MPKAVSLFLIRDGTQFAAECPLLAQSGHTLVRCECPLSGVKQTSLGHAAMSAFDPKRTWLVRPATMPCLEASGQP